MYKPRLFTDSWQYNVCDSRFVVTQERTTNNHEDNIKGKETYIHLT